MLRKRLFLLVLLGVLTVHAACALALRLFLGGVTSADAAFAADLRLLLQRSEERALNQPRQPPRVFISELRVHEGEAAPQFSLRDADGHETRLKDLVRRLPVVVEFGSFT